MQQPGHTPGPWACDSEGIIESGEIVICVVGRADESFTQTADAALICAAPDLLALLKEARVIVTWGGTEHFPPGTATATWLDDIDAAIAKATGGAV